MDRVNCRVGVYARVCANEYVMGLFDWWGCYCQSIHHFSSAASILLFFTLSLSLPASMILHFLVLLTLAAPNLSLFFLSCNSLLFFFSLFFWISSPLFLHVVLVSAKLRVQDGQWVQDGGVWPRKSNGSWDRGEFLNTQAQTHFSLKHPFSTSMLHATLQLLRPRFISHLLMISSDCWTSPWPSIHALWLPWLCVRMCVRIIHLVLRNLKHAGSLGFVEKRVVPSYMKFYSAIVQCVLCATNHVTYALVCACGKMCVFVGM